MPLAAPVITAVRPAWKMGLSDIVLSVKRGIGQVYRKPSRAVAFDGAGMRKAADQIHD